MNNNGNGFDNIFEQPYQPYKKMSRSELEVELTKWRNIWTWVEPDIQFYLTRVNSLVRFVRRDYKSIEGRLGQVHSDIKSIEIDTQEREYDYTQGEAAYLTRTVTCPLSNMADFSFIHTKEVVREDTNGETFEDSKPDFNKKNIVKE